MSAEYTAKLRRQGRQAARRQRYAAMDRADLLATYGTKLLAKDGFYPKPEKSEFEYDPVDAEGITVAGHLRATWTGRP